MRVLLLLLLVFLSVATTNGAIYEDQIDEFDWHQSYIGKVNSASSSSYDNKNSIVVTSLQSVARLNLTNGNIIWRNPIKSSIVSLDNPNYIVSLSDDTNQNTIRVYESSTGVLRYTTLTSSSSIKSMSVSKTHIVTLDNNSNLSLYIIGDGKLDWSVKLKTPVTNVVINQYNIITVASSSYLATINVSNGKVLEEKAITASSNDMTLTTPTQEAVVVSCSDKKLQLDTIKHDTKVITTTSNNCNDVFEISNDFSVVVQPKFDFIMSDGASVDSVFKLNQRLSLVVMKDHALVCVKDEKTILWVREEGLASIEYAAFVTPSKSGGSTVQDDIVFEIPSFTESLVLQLHSLRNFFKNTSMTESKSHFFGFSKLIIAFSPSARKVFGISSETGSVEWKIYNEEWTSDYKMIVTRDHLGMGGVGAEIMLVSRTSPYYYWINAETGTVLDVKQEEDQDERTDSIVLLPKHHTMKDTSTIASSKRVVAFIKNSDVVLHPPTTESLLELQQSSPLYYVKQFPDKVQGYKIQGSTSTLVWKLKFDEILKTAVINQNDKIDSSVTITGDDSLLTKYLNPHLMTVASSNGNELVFTVLDTVSGRILHRVSHPEADNVDIQMSENWIVYSYFNYETLQTELGSIALYEGAIGSHSLNLFKRPVWASHTSSFTSKLPIVLQKAFVLPTNAKVMAVTRTSQGITPSFFVLGMPTGQLYLLSHKLIDPRSRPETKVLSVDQKSEGLVPYYPHLPINPFAMISYNRSVASLQNVVTSATALESTSLLFGYGLDLYFIRTVPAKAFDLLPSDFHYELLLLLVIGLLTATFVMKSLASRKKLYDAWK